ncbi:MAG: ATP-binding protein [Armatimonadetes bacterium]|nr:ATP-binding protein [Akkermansiaceae bacterium]
MTTSKIVLSPGQEQALEKLRPLVDLATSGICKRLPFRPRTSVLLIGPSGTGKSHIAKELARQCNLPFWEANMANWIVLGARSETHTFKLLADWIHQHDSGVIFTDELDKLSGSGSDWLNSVRLETHDLLDGRVPNAAVVPSGISKLEELAGLHSGELTQDFMMADIREKLRTRFFVIGAGAWMGGWQENRQQLGFNSTTSADRRPDRRQILQSISPELLQRFRRDVIYLDPMTKREYQQVAASIIARLPKTLVDSFLRACTPAIEMALEECLGMRIFEEILADVWAAEYAVHRNNTNAWTYLTRYP